MKFKHFSFLIIIVALGSLVWTACQKNDLSGSKTAEDRSAEKFFNSYTSSKPAVNALQQYAQRKNEKLPFASKMIRKAGIPRWDKALVFENVKTTGRGDQLGENTTVIHVPMVPENGNMVQGSLMVRMSAEDTVMNLVAAQDYASYGFGAAPAGGWNAHDVFTVLTKLDNMVFGRTTYRVTDGRILGDSQQVQRKVTINHDVPDPNLNDLFVVLTFTTSQTVCIIAGEPGSGPGVCTTFILTTYLYVQIPDGDGGGGGGGTGGGPTGGGGTGGTGGIGGGWEDWEDDPEFDEDAEISLLTQVFNTTTMPHIEDITFTSPTATEVPFQWIVVKNSFNLWQVTSYDVAHGYNSVNTGAILYNIVHTGSSISGQTSWNRIRRSPIGPNVPLVSLSWAEVSNSKTIAGDYKSGTVTVSGNVLNFGMMPDPHIQSCTIRVH